MCVCVCVCVCWGGGGGGVEGDGSRMGYKNSLCHAMVIYVMMHTKV